MQLFQYEKIETTLAKAKAIQPEAEKLITMAKKQLRWQRSRSD
jgi:ribosomal protein L17